MNDRIVRLAGALALLAAAGCTSGDFRKVPLTRDLSEADLVHFRNLSAGAAGTSSKVEDFHLGLPFWPVLCGSRETTVDRRDDGATYVHVEDHDGVVLYLLGASATVANFGPDGRNLDWSDTDSVLLGLLRASRGEHDAAGGRARRSGFHVLWGMFGTSSDGADRTWRFLWIPI